MTRDESGCGWELVLSFNRKGASLVFWVPHLSLESRCLPDRSCSPQTRPERWCCSFLQVVGLPGRLGQTFCIGVIAVDSSAFCLNEGFSLSWPLSPSR